MRGTALRGAARAEYMRDAHIAAKGDLTWKERNAAANEYWAQVDAQLVRDLDEAKRVLSHKPMKRKRVVEVARPRPATAMSKAFEKARRR